VVLVATAENRGAPIVVRIGVDWFYQ